MQSTGQTSTHAVSFVPMHGSQMIYAIALIVSQTWPSTGSGHPERAISAGRVEGCVSDLAALFTPPQPVVGRYETCVATEPLEKVVVNGAGDTGVHYGAVAETDWFGAFGSAGPYDRARVARLYGGTAVRVTRGWRKTGDRFESITLISPYPDATLTHLNPGTLIIRFSIISVSP